MIRILLIPSRISTRSVARPPGPSAHPVDAFAKIPIRNFSSIMVRAGIVRTAFFVVFALVHEVIFRDVVHVQFTIEMLVRGASTWFASVAG